MAYWDGKKIVSLSTKVCKQYPNWDEIDCGCCGGLQWGGEDPKECITCDGRGIIYKHRKSGVIAEYPGGRFTG